MRWPRRPASTVRRGSAALRTRWRCWSWPSEREGRLIFVRFRSPALLKTGVFSRPEMRSGAIFFVRLRPRADAFPRLRRTVPLRHPAVVSRVLDSRTWRSPLVPRDRSSLLPVLRNVATQLRIDSVRSTTARRQRPSDNVLFGRRPRGRAVLLGDALRPEAAAPRPTAIASCCRRATPRRCSTPRGRRSALPARRAAQAARVRHRTSKDTRRRGCRSSMSPRARSDRASAPRSASRSTRAASGPTTARTSCWATAKAAEGSVWEAAESRRVPQARFNLRHHRRQSASARAGRRCGSTTWRPTRASGARSAGTPSSSTATTWPRSSTRSTRRAPPRASRR